MARRVVMHHDVGGWIVVVVVSLMWTIISTKNAVVCATAAFLSSTSTPARHHHRHHPSSLVTTSSLRNIAANGGASRGKTRRKKSSNNNNSNKQRRRSGSSSYNQNYNNKKNGQTQQRQNQQRRDEREDPAASTSTTMMTQEQPHHQRAIINNKDDDDTMIGCEHFDVCAGCIVNDTVDSEISVIQAAKRYFASPGIQNKILMPQQQGRRRRRRQADADADEEDEFAYRVIIPTPLTGWRTQAKLAVAAKSSTWKRHDGCTFGLYKERTHEVLPIPHCAVHHPSINHAVQVLEHATAKVSTQAYSEQQQSYHDDSTGSSLRYVQFQVERATGKICLTLVWNASHIKQCQLAVSRLVKQLTKSEPHLWHSIWCHCNDSIGNNIFARNPKRWYKLVGPEFLREPLPVQLISDEREDGDDMGDDTNRKKHTAAAAAAGFLYYTPSNFRQGNMDGFDRIALDVAKAVPGGSKVCELYAGVGVLGLTALAYHHDQNGQDQPLQWIRCSDENPGNPRCFQRAVDSLPASVTGRHPKHRTRHKNNDFDKRNKNRRRRRRRSDELVGLTLGDVSNMMMNDNDRDFGNNNDDFTSREKTSYCVASAGAALLRGEALGANVLIVDPPRKGLEDTVVEELCKPFNPDQPYMESSTLMPMDDSQVNWTNDVQTLIYVSCGFDALARDCERLLSSPGGWMLESATGYLLFPGSDHVESLCIFQRK